MPAGREKVSVAADTRVRPRGDGGRGRSVSAGRYLRNFSSTDFRTASKTALSALPPSHTAGIVPFATAPQIVIVYYLAWRWRSFRPLMAAEKADMWFAATNAVIRPVANFT